MTYKKLMVDSGKASLDTLLPLTKVQTEADVKKYRTAGYQIGMTAKEFEERYPLLPIDSIYVAFGLPIPLYYCQLYNRTVPIALNLQIFGKQRLNEDTEDDEQFQRHILHTAKQLASGDTERIHQYVSSLEYGLRVSILSKYIKRTTPSPELYSLFLDIYRATDYGFSAFDKEDLEKVVSGKSNAQKETTAANLKDLPEVVTIYRGEGTTSTPYRKAFSWTTDYNSALFFACRIQSAENSRIISAEIPKAAILEYFPKDGEKEVFVLPTSVKHAKVDTLYGINALEQEVEDIMPIYQFYRKRIAAVYDEYGKGEHPAHDGVHTLRVLFNALLLIRLQKIYLEPEEMMQLCDGILYHDIGRTGDGVDEEHGKKSKQIYIKDTAENDPVISFLIEYHCVDDGIVRSVLDSLEVEEKDRIWLLYTILKDADALDRVRFGIRAIDPKYLRNPMAHKLIPVAYSSVDQLKL